MYRLVPAIDHRLKDGLLSRFRLTANLERLFFFVHLLYKKFLRKEVLKKIKIGKSNLCIIDHLI